jgi:hypothetical protein
LSNRNQAANPERQPQGWRKPKIGEVTGNKFSKEEQLKNTIITTQGYTGLRAKNGKPNQN